jgi:sortase (surface protein transpeptidase)
MTQARVAVAYVVIGSALLATACGASATPQEIAGPAAVATQARSAPAETQAVAPAETQVADPARVRIPAIDVDAAVLPLAVDGQGVLPPPPTNVDTGWWRAGPEPGEAGPAVIVGHVDGPEGPAVFFRLRQLVHGDEIAVDRVDGSTAVFAVERVERHAKNAFPTEAVYGHTPDARLRLVTCGGEFDRSTRHYVDNVVVFAVLAA